MTAQTAETLRFENEDMLLFAELPEPFLRSLPTRPDFRVPHTGLWRGYVGSWEIDDGRLYLTDIDAAFEDGSEVTLESLFPGCGGARVFADWYTGTLRVPRGTMIRYFHGGFESTYERHLLLTFAAGVLIGRFERENTPSLPDGPPGDLE